MPLGPQFLWSEGKVPPLRVLGSYLNRKIVWKLGQEKTKKNKTKQISPHSLWPTGQGSLSHSSNNKKRTSIGDFSACNQCAIPDVSDCFWVHARRARVKIIRKVPTDLVVCQDLSSFPKVPVIIYFPESSNSCSTYSIKGFELYLVGDAG